MDTYVLETVVFIDKHFQNMKFVQQRIRLKVSNLDSSRDRVKRRHGTLLPSSVRCLICGPSNCGKTNVMVSLLLDANGLKYKNIYLYSKTPFQPKYKSLETILRKVKDIGYSVFSENVEIIKPTDAKQHSIFIFDDVACDKQNVMREYFSMGRHSLIDSFYLCQTYTRIPKQLIRDNANLLVLFRQDETNLKHIYEDHVTTDLTFTEFKDLCSVCWKGKYGFLVIDKDSEMDSGRYRKGFDVYIKR